MIIVSKKPITIALVIMVSALLCLFYFLLDTNQRGGGKPAATPLHDNDIANNSNTQLSRTHKLAFQVNITSTMSSADAESNKSSISFKLALKQAEEGNKGANKASLFLGNTYNIDIKGGQSPADGALPSTLAFTTQYQAGYFNDINLLQLPANHPLNIVRTILNHFSFSKNKALELELADGAYTFQYSLKGNKVTRKVLKSENYVQSADIFQLVSQSDDWLVMVDNKNIQQSLQYVTSRQVNYSGQLLNINQMITIEAIPFPESFNDEPAFYISDANKNYIIENQVANKSIKIENDEQFLNALNNFVEASDIYDAKIIGQYAAQQAGLSFALEFLLDPNQNDQHKSALIFALEQSGVSEADYVLSNIILNESIDEQNRLRAITSIAKLGKAASSVALDTLQQLTHIENKTIADTALLNIGIMGKHAEHLKYDVTQYLSDKLKSRDNNTPYISLLAVSNLNSAELNNHVASYLTSENYDERMVASRILGKSEEYQSTLMDHLLAEENPSVAEEIIESFLSKNSPSALPESYQSKLRQRIQSTKMVPLRERLEKLLTDS